MLDNDQASVESAAAARGAVTRSEIFLLVFVLAASYAARLAYVVYLGPGLFEAVYPDEKNYYLAAAQEMRTHGVGSFFGSPRALWNGPFMPFWVYLFQSNIVFLKLVNNLFVSLGGAAVWLMVRRFTNARWAFLAAALFAFFPPWFVFGPTVVTEPPFVCFTLLGLACMGSEGTRRRAFCGGVLFGLGTLVRPTTQLFPVAAAGCAVFLWLLAIAVRSNGWVRNVSPRMIAFAIGAALLPMLWIAHNGIVLGQPKLANGFGAVLYLGNDLRKNGDEPIYTGQSFDTFELTRPYAHLDTEGDRILTTEAKRMMERFPLRTVRLTLFKACRYMFGNADGYFYPARNVLAMIKNRPAAETLFAGSWLVLNSLVVCAGLVSVPAVLWCRRSADAVLLVLLSAYLVALHAISFPIPRLELPFFGVMCVLGACGLSGAPRSRMLAIIAALAVSCFVGFAEFTSSSLSAAEQRDAAEDLRIVNLASPVAVNNVRRSSSGWTVTGNDPYLMYSVDPVALTPNTFVFFELELSCAAGITPKAGSDIQLFLKLHDQEWSETNSEVAPLPSESPGLLRFRMGRLGETSNATLEGLRVDFPASRTDCTFTPKALSVEK